MFSFCDGKNCFQIEQRTKHLKYVIPLTNRMRTVTNPTCDSLKIGGKYSPKNTLTVKGPIIHSIIRSAI